MYVDPKLKYLMRIQDYYYSKEAEEYINSKISEITKKDNSLFCVECSRKFILKINCTAKLDNEKYIIFCKKCGKKSQINVQSNK